MFKFFTRKMVIPLFLLAVSSFSKAAIIEKELLYDKYTLPDTYIVKIGDNYTQRRGYDWNRISNILDGIDGFLSDGTLVGSLKNYKNVNGKPAAAMNMKSSPESDIYGVRRTQGIPLYSQGNLNKPERYAWDGSLVKILSKEGSFTKVQVKDIEGTWLIPNRYVETLSPRKFNKVVIINRNFQNVVTLERVGGIWKIRSKNPITTGKNKLPYSYATPLGTFVAQNKLRRMDYMKFGNENEPGGYAPYATRFSGGGYFHGFPVDLPRKDIIEYSNSLGSLPISHMCVRSSASHAQFVYNWGEVDKTLFIVIE
ncbi:MULTISPECIES: L,D-transpeptidase [Cetobacterium]|uniref:L,D-transpeptidase n=1 Tax=Candidatus Cetobacterium colombiensis TaxID=3073100 RepID=A0ABU4WBI8_9FUSO|nr:L,D-transpeptidase [Candidatus Cetobacterium colombiensis]MDX8336039.1 L,D-transpeptidase [Candidatus Cetobacterium colombiensis]